MSDPIQGSIEIRTANNESIGVAGKRWTLEAVPVVLETLYGVTGMSASTSKQQPTGRVPEAQWSAVDANNQSITVLLWSEVPYEQTAIAQAIAAEITLAEERDDYAK